MTIERPGSSDWDHGMLWICTRKCYVSPLLDFKVRIKSCWVIDRMSYSLYTFFGTISSIQSGSLATYWVPGAIGHSILRPEDPILSESQSSLGVPRACLATPSLLLLVLEDDFSENPPFWQTSQCPITTPTPLENDPTPFTKNSWLVPGFSCSTGWGWWIGQCPSKKKSNDGYSNSNNLSQLSMDPDSTPPSKSKWQTRVCPFLTTRKPGLRRARWSQGWGGSGVLTTSSCGSNPDGYGDLVGAQKCRCMMQTCSLAHWRQPYVCALKAEKAAPDVLGCGSTQILESHICFFVRAGFSFARGNTGKHNTIPSETQYLRQWNC